MNVTTLHSTPAPPTPPTSFVNIIGQRTASAGVRDAAAAGSHLVVAGCKYNASVMILLITATEEQLQENTGQLKKEALYCD